MTRHLIIFAVLSALALTACKPSAEPATPAPAPSVAEAVAPTVDAEPAPASVVQAAPTQADLVGTYAGTLPCASCPGIDTRLTLAADNSYLLEETYQERADGHFSQQGMWLLGENGQITLVAANSDDGAKVLRVDDANTLRQLGQDDSDPGALYTLHRQ